MTELIAQVTTTLTGILGWIGSILTFMVGEPLLLIGLVFSLIGSAIGIYKAIRH